MRNRHARTDQTESNRRNNEFIFFYFKCVHFSVYGWRVNLQKEIIMKWYINGMVLQISNKNYNNERSVFIDVLFYTVMISFPVTPFV